MTMRPLPPATRRRVRIDRYNGGSLRRYHIPGGAIIVVRSDMRSVVILPAWCNHISAPISRGEAARLLRDLRAGKNPAQAE